MRIVIMNTNITVKVCSTCKTEKSLEDFEFRADRNSHRGICRQCIAIRRKKYVNDNRPRMQKMWSRYYNANKERCKKSVSISRRKHRESNPAKYMWMHIRHKCRKLNIPFNIEISDIIIPEFCPVLGIKLEMGNTKGQDNSPSIDRMIPSLGYVKGNITIMSKRANTIKNDGTLEEHEKITNWMREKLK